MFKESSCIIYLHDVVGEGEEGREGEGGGEHGDEPVLDHQLQVLVKQRELVPGLTSGKNKRFLYRRISKIISVFVLLHRMQHDMTTEDAVNLSHAIE